MNLKTDFLKYQAQTTEFATALEISHAQGSYIYDKNNKEYLDFVAGVSVNTIGHSHPAIINAITEQINKYLHVMVYGEYILEKSVDLCKLLAEITPPPLETTYLVNSGAEAIEGALKLAKRWTGKEKIISFKNSYHGNTHGALSVSGNEYHKRMFRPMLPLVEFIEFNNENELNKIDDNTAAVIMETIQGAAGFVIPSKTFMKSLRCKCTETNTLLILDEIQPGFGRTGKLFAFEHFDIVPDILVMGKGMGGGVPIGAFMSSNEIMSSLSKNPKLGHITTFGGNPLIAASSLATINTILNENIISEIYNKEKLFRQLLIHPNIKKIHGIGLMLALELKSAEYCLKVAKECLENSLIVFWQLYKNNFLRITPPLNISDDDIKKGCEIIIKVLDKDI